MKSPGPIVQPAARGGGLQARLSTLAAPLLVAVAVQSVANLIFHSVAGRALSPNEYGALGTILAAMTLVAVPLSAVQTAAARTAAARGVTRSTTVRALVRTIWYSSPAVIAIALFSVPMAEFLHLSSAWEAFILAPTLLVAALVAVMRGLLLGTGQSRTVALSYLAATAGRLGPGLALAWYIGVAGALIGTLLGEILALAVSLFAALKAGPGASQVISARELVRTGVAVTGLFLFTTVDLFLARHYLPGGESGTYVAAATIGKTILALPAAAISIAYPKLVQAWNSSTGRRPTLRSAALVVGAPALLGAVIVCAVPGLLMTLMFGPGSFTESDNLLRVLALVAGSCAFVSFLIHAALARDSWGAFIPWAGAALEVGIISIWHSSALEISLGSAAALILTLMTLTVLELPPWLAGNPRDEGRSSQHDAQTPVAS